jgi:hypothetical protein
MDTPHYICTGSCHGVSDKPGVCGSATCEKKGQPLTPCGDGDVSARLTAIEQRLEATFKAADKTRKYMMWTGIITIAMIILPLIGLLFVIPQYLNTLDIYKMF